MATYHYRQYCILYAIVFVNVPDTLAMRILSINPFKHLFIKFSG